MTPAARYAAAIDVLDVWLSGTALDRALTGWARGARYAGSKDRAAVRDHVFDVLRCRGSAAHLGGGETGRALVLGLLRLQGIDPASVFTGDGHAPPVLSVAEAGYAPGAAPLGMDIPAWTSPMLSARMAGDLDALLEAFQTRAPVYLRVNTRLADRETAQATLAADGVTATPDPEVHTALRVTDGARRINRTQAYLDGWVELQDLSVQAAVNAVPWPTQGRILDYCAGGGGKSLAISPRVAARVFAHDADPRRMTDLAARADRAGAAIAGLATAELARHAPYDAVLCDVPCSGSGTWRRDPEAKWNLTPDRLSALTLTQDGILDAAAALVAPHGLLVYMTCSLFHPENEDRIAAFCARSPEWVVETQRIDTPLSLSDGFFTAVLRRRATKP
jgi:16S rRNA (cytosine967-C5)-methyltransferase